MSAESGWNPVAREVVDVGGGAVAAEREHQRVDGRAEREAERLAGGPDAGVDAGPVLAGAPGVHRRRVGEHRHREDLGAGVPEPDQRRRGVHPPRGGRVATRRAAAAASGEDERGGDVPLLLADPLAQRAPGRGQQQRRTDEADEQDRGRALVDEHPARDVGDAGEHRAGGQRLHHEGAEQQPEVAGAGDDAQLLAQRPGAGGDPADRRATGCRRTRRRRRSTSSTAMATPMTR